METINITLKVDTSEVAKLQRELDEHFQVIEFKVLPSTDEMYEADDTFKALSKLKKKAKTEVEKYINDNNQKYLLK